ILGLTRSSSSLSTRFPYTTLFRSGSGEFWERSACSHDGETDDFFTDSQGLSHGDGIVYDEFPAAYQSSQTEEYQNPDLQIGVIRSEDHTSEHQSREISYAVFCLKK